jgi:hypothetical protein
MEPAWLAVACLLVLGVALVARLTVELGRRSRSLRAEITATRALGAELDRLRQDLGRLDVDLDRAVRHPALSPARPTPPQLGSGAAP